jgi:benzodiazapine receptor
LQLRTGMKTSSKVGFAIAAGAATAGVLGIPFNPRPGTPTGDWYDKLEKSPLNPPNGVFGPVWTVLYTLMGISAYRVWRSPANADRTAALRLWPTQLALNAVWSPIFFGAKRPDLSLADMTALLVAIVAYIRVAYRIDRPAALLFGPYLAWVSFAYVLNAEIVRRNRTNPA